MERMGICPTRSKLSLSWHARTISVIANLLCKEFLLGSGKPQRKKLAVLGAALGPGLLGTLASFQLSTVWRPLVLVELSDP
jgi:hypothetical protein